MQGHSYLEELSWRGLLFQHTEGAAAALAKGVVTGYCGFDPTAASLHAGNLVAIMSLVHLQRAGHRPVALVGGGTGMIGDPSGKSSERQLLTTDLVDANIAGIQSQLERVLDFDGPRGALMRNNAEWLRPLDLIGFLRDVGKHFTVNYMMQKDSVDSRLTSESGISFTEFSYMLLQAYDFAELYRRDGVTLQAGGSDQWGNITAGTTLVRKLHSAEAHGVTLPLLTTSAGTKFGKSEAGAVWLDAARTSPYQFYQFWMGADDQEVGRYLRTFTLLSRDEIESLDAATLAAAHKRESQQVLARTVTTLIHGADAARTAAEVSTLLFAKGDPRALSEAALHSLRAELRAVQVASGPSFDTLEVFVQTGLAKSRGDARRLLEAGSLSVNGTKLSASETAIASDQLLFGSDLILKRGAKDFGMVTLQR
jgi:tyrosyl-tRNA synthetase